VIVIGRAARDVSEEESLDYIAGYMTGNDLSCRMWQRNPLYAGNVPQWCFSKGFDGFAPVGPMIVSPSILGSAENQSLLTLVNNEPRQVSETSDLLFSVRNIVSFLSQGTTLEFGTLIMTGTPSGVAMGMKVPRYLSNGDEVEVRIGGLGSLKNKMVFV
jgi:2-keto-4-pentenoate hydratase/2-oxohepta-3-ene-1,7-dioic acid hydratase in catechol pathway